MNLAFQIRHAVENGKINFFVYSTSNITKGTELTIPFDYDSKDR